MVGISPRLLFFFWGGVIFFVVCLQAHDMGLDCSSGRFLSGGTFCFPPK